MRFGAIVVAAFLAVDPFGWDHVGPFRFALISTLGFATVAASLGAGDARPQPLPRWAVIGWAVVIVGLITSTIVSPDPWHALIGTPDRHFGLATWLLVAGLFAVSSIYPNSIVSFVTGGTVIAALGAGVWSVLEQYDVGWFASSFADDRIGGPFEQPAYLGAGMLLLIPVCASVAAKTEQHVIERGIAAAAAALALVALGLSQSRGAWVAFAVTAVLLVVRRRMLKTGLVGLVAIGLLIGLSPVGDRLNTLTTVSEGVVAGRIDEWQVGGRAVIDTPTFGITGHGPEGYRIVFGQHVDREYVIDHGRTVITDRAHSGLLDVALSGGLLAGGGMVLLYAGLATTALQRLRASDPTDVALGAAVLAFLLQQLVLFPLAELDPVLWILAGLLVARRPLRDQYRPPLFRHVSGARRAAMLGAGLLAALSAIAGLSDVAADHSVANAVDATEPERALELADTARSRRPDSIRYDFIAARIAARPGTLNGLEAALERLDDGLSVSPQDPALRIERGGVLLEIARLTDTEDDLEIAQADLDALMIDEPRHPQVLMHLGIARALAGDDGGAIEVLERSADLDPTNVEPLINLAVVLLEGGDLDRGSDVLDQIEALAPSNSNAQGLRREFLSE